MDNMVDLDVAFTRYMDAKRSVGYYPLDDVDNDDDLEVGVALERVRLARAAFQDMLERKPVSGEDRVLTNVLKAELYKAEAALTRVKRAKETTPLSHLL